MKMRQIHEVNDNGNLKIITEHFDETGKVLKRDIRFCVGESLNFQPPAKQEEKVIGNV